MSKLLMIVCVMWGFSGASFAENEPIKMLFVGDVMLAETPGKLIKNGQNPFQYFDALFKRADIKIGNLECTVSLKGTAEEKPFTFRANPRVIPVLKKHFTAVSVANNHSGDFGALAFADMLDNLDQGKMPYIGGGHNLRAAHQPFIIEVKGKRIAILAYNEFFPRSFEALPDRAGIAWSDDDFVKHDIQQAKLKADLVIVYPHWGWEHEKMSSARQQYLAHLMIDSGADVIVGGHPHVTQNIEMYQGKPIFYSLGNFVFNGFDDEETTTGWALELTMSADSKIAWHIYTAKLDKNGTPHLRDE
jgi:poly-gamma-glutamate synthesis protein (capsule biosynthesis protein)